MMDDIDTSSCSHDVLTRDVWTASDTEKVIQVLRDGRNYEDVAELRSATHKYDISIPPSRPVDELESVALCILQHAAANFQVSSVDELIGVLRQTSIGHDSHVLTTFPVKLCHLRLEMAELRCSVIELLDEILLSVIPLFPSRCLKLSQKRLADYCWEILGFEFGSVLLWKCSGDNSGMFHTFVRRPLLYEHAVEYGTALVEDLCEQKFFADHIGKKVLQASEIDSTEISSVLPKITQFLEPCVASKSVKELMGSLELTATLNEDADFLCWLARLEARGMLDSNSLNHLLQLVKSNIVHTVEIAVGELIMEHKNIVELEQLWLGGENETLVQHINEVHEDIKAHDEKRKYHHRQLVEMRCKVKSMEALQMKARQNALEMEKEEARLEVQLSELEATKEQHGESCSQLKSELERLRRKREGLLVRASDCETELEATRQARVQKQLELEELYKKRDWLKFLDKVRKCQPDSETIVNLVSSVRRYEKYRSLEELVRNIVEDLDLRGWTKNRSANRSFWAYVDTNCKDDFEFLLNMFSKLFCSPPSIGRNINNKCIVEVTGRYIVLSQVVSDLQEKISSHGVDEVWFAAAEKLFLDSCLLQLGGISISMTAPIIVVGDDMIVETSGSNATPSTHRKAADAKRPGENGDHGMDGRPGESAGNIFIEASKNFKGINKLTLIANGGHGSYGQSGGDGVDGKNGNDGRDGVEKNAPSSGTLSVKEGTKGERGKSGGDGGNAGKGGLGGRGGDITVISAQVPVDLNNLHSVQNDAGRNGADGKPGKGGSGGLGGRDGVNNYWAWEASRYIGLLFWPLTGEWIHKRGLCKVIEQRHAINNLIGHQLEVIKTENDMHSERSSKGYAGDKGLSTEQLSSKAKQPATKRSIDVKGVQGLGKAVRKYFPTSASAISADGIENTIEGIESQCAVLNDQSQGLEECVNKIKLEAKAMSDESSALSKQHGVLQNDASSVANAGLKLEQQKLAVSQKRKSLQSNSLFQEVKKQTENKRARDAQASLVEEQEALARTKCLEENLLEQQSVNAEQMRTVVGKLKVLEVLEENCKQELVRYQQLVQQRQTVEVHVKHVRRMQFDDTMETRADAGVSEPREDLNYCCDSDPFISVSNLLSKVDVSLSIDFERSIQRYRLIVPNARVCKQLDAIGNHLAQALRAAFPFLKSAKCHKYFADGLLSDVMLSEQCFSEDSKSDFDSLPFCKQLFNIVKVKNSIALPSFAYTVFMFRLFPFNEIDDLKLLETTCVSDLKECKVNSDNAKLLKHFYSIILDHYVDYYARDAVLVKVGVDHKLLYKIGCVVTEQELEVSAAPLYIAYSKLISDYKVNYCMTMESFILSLTGLPGSHVSDCTLASVLSKILVTDPKAVAHLRCAKSIFNSISLSLENLDDSRMALLALKYSALISAVHHHDLLSEIECFLGDTGQYYAKNFCQKDLMDIKRMLKEKKTTAELSEMVSKFEQLITGACNMSTMSRKHELCCRVMKMLETSPVSSDLLMEMAVVTDDMAADASRLPCWTLSGKFHDAISAYNKKMTAKNLVEVLKLLQGDSARANASSGTSQRGILQFWKRNETVDPEWMLVEFSDRVCFFCENFDVTVDDIKLLCDCIVSLDESIRVLSRSKMLDSATSVFALFLKRAANKVDQSIKDEWMKAEKFQSKIERHWENTIDKSQKILEPTRQLMHLKCLQKKLFIMFEASGDLKSAENDLKNLKKRAESGKLDECAKLLKDLTITCVVSQLQKRHNQHKNKDQVLAILMSVNGFEKLCTAAFSQLQKEPCTPKLADSIERLVLVATNQFWEDDTETKDKCTRLYDITKEICNIRSKITALSDVVAAQLSSLQTLIVSFLQDDELTVFEFLTNRILSLRSEQQQMFNVLCTGINDDLTFLLRPWENFRGISSVAATYTRSIEKNVLLKYCSLKTEEKLLAKENCLVLALQDKLILNGFDRLSALFKPLLEVTELGDVNLLCVISRDIDRLLASCTPDSSSIEAFCDVRHLLLGYMEDHLSRFIASLFISNADEVQCEINQQMKQLAYVVIPDDTNAELERLRFTFRLNEKLIKTELNAEHLADYRQILVRLALELSLSEVAGDCTANDSIFHCLATALLQNELNHIERDYCYRLLGDRTGRSLTASSKRRAECVEFIRGLNDRSRTSMEPKNRLVAYFRVYGFTRDEDNLLQYLEKYGKLAKPTKNCTTALEFVQYVVQNVSPSQWNELFKEAILDVMFKTLLSKVRSDVALNSSLTCGLMDSQLDRFIELLSHVSESSQTDVLVDEELSAYLYLLSDTASAKLKDLLELLSDFKMAFNRSNFFATESNSESDWLAWVHVMCVGLHTDSVLSLKDLTEIFHRSVDADLTELLHIVMSCLPCHWLPKMLSTSILDHIEIKLTYFNLDDSLKKAEDLLRNISFHGTQLIGVLADKLAAEADWKISGLNSATSTLSASAILELLKELGPFTGASQCHTLYRRLKSMPLGRWPVVLREQKLLATWSADVVPLILKLENNVGRPLINKLLDSFNGNNELLMQVCSYFRNCPWMLNDEVADKLINALTETGDGWIKLLEEHRQQLRTERQGDQLVKLMKNDLGNAAIRKLLESSNSNACILMKRLQHIRDVTSTIEHWKQSDIKDWASRTRKSGIGSLDEELTEKHIEAMAVVCQAIKLITEKGDCIGFYPRDTQLLVLLIFLDYVQMRKGCLGEIATGEGKTVTIAMFVILQVLSKVCVDVISSSSVLAVEGAKEMQQLFKLFDISVGNNCDEACEKDEIECRERYKNDVIYGDLGSFQRDFLLTKFFEKGITRNREPGCIVVDEVDSMLLDKSTNVLYLSHDMPDFKHFNLLFVEIWQAVHAPDVHLGRESDIASVVKYISERLKENSLELPKYLQSIVDRHLVFWVKNAFVAKNYAKANDSYILADVSGKGKQVVVMDKDTGVEQIQMHWSHGLHQFLQLKHCDNLQSESLRAVFMSNLGYFKRFVGKTFGVSGTLGSAAERALLSEAYQLETFTVPRFKARFCTEREACIVDFYEHWITQIVHSIAKESKEQRAMLVVCENIEVVEAVVKALIKEKQTTHTIKRIYSYKSAFDNVLHNNNSKNPLSVGDVVVATNLAGRGTNLKISSCVEKHGGLHVIITFMPANIRTEKQAEGRTARSGQSGSFQFIIINNDGDTTEIEELKKRRDEKECRRLEDVRQTSFRRLDIEEQLFDKFQVLFGGVKNKLRPVSTVVQAGMELMGVSKVITKSVTEKVRTTQMDNVTEYGKLQLEFMLNHWALWFDEMDDKLDTLDSNCEQTIMNDFDKFRSETLRDIDGDSQIKLAKYPIELIKLGQHFENHNKFSLADQCFTQATDMDRRYSEVALYYRASCILHQDSGQYARQKALTDLRESRTLLYKRLNVLTDSIQTLQMTTQFRREAGDAVFDSRYEKQVRNISQLTGVHISAIDTAVGRDLDVQWCESVRGVSGSDEAQQLFVAVRHLPDVCKNFRLSRKLKVREDHLMLSKPGSNVPKRIDLPSILSCCKDDILKSIATRLQSGSDRVVEDDGFQDQVVSRTDIWDILLRCGFIENSIVRKEYTVDYDGERFENLEFTESLACYKSEIQKLLSRDHGKPYDKVNTLANLELKVELAEALDKMILDEKFVVVNECTSAKLSSKFTTTRTKQQAAVIKSEAQSKSELQPWIVDFSNTESCLVVYFPLDLTVYSDIIRDWLSNDGKNETVSKENIALHFEDKQSASRYLWSRLREAGAIKGCQVNYSLKKKSSKPLEEWLKSAEKQLTSSSVVKKTFSEFHGSESAGGFDSGTKFTLTDYANSIQNSLKSAIGEITTLNSVNTGYHGIEQYFMTADEYPPEINDFQVAAFAQVLTLGEKTPRWSWGAFWVAMIGLSQIALGLALAYFSGGSALPFAMALIGEGVGDLIFATQAGLSNTFTWQNYAIQKGISIGITAISFGVGAWLNRGRQTASAAMTGVQVFRLCATQAVKMVATSATFLIIDHGIEYALALLRTKLVAWFADNIKAAVASIFSKSIKTMKTLMNDIFCADPKVATKTVSDAFSSATKKAMDYASSAGYVEKAVDAAKQITGRCLDSYSDHLLDKARGLGEGGNNIVSNAAHIQKFVKITLPLIVATNNFVKRAIDLSMFAKAYIDCITGILAQHKKQLNDRRANRKEQTIGKDENAEKSFIKLTDDKLAEAQMVIGDRACLELQKGLLQPAVQALTHFGVTKIGSALVKRATAYLNELGYLDGIKRIHDANLTDDDGSSKERDRNHVGMNEKVANSGGVEVKHLVEAYGKENLKFYRDNHGNVHIERPSYRTFCNTIGGGKKAGMLEIMIAANALNRPIKVVDTTGELSDSEIVFYPGGKKTDKEPMTIEFSKNEQGQGHFLPIIDGVPVQVPVNTAGTPNDCLYESLAYFRGPNSKPADVIKQVKRYAESSTTCKYLYKWQVQEWSVNLWGGSSKKRLSKRTEGTKWEKKETHKDEKGNTYILWTEDRKDRDPNQAEPTNKEMEESRNLLNQWDGHQQIRNKYPNIRLDDQGQFDSKDPLAPGVRYTNYQMQLNKSRSKGESTTIALLLTPELDPPIPGHLNRRSMELSLNSGKKSVITKEPKNNKPSPTSQK